MGAPASLRDDTPENAPRCRFWKHKDGGDIVPTDATSTKAFLFLDPDDWIQVDVNGNPVGRWLDAPTCDGWWWCDRDWEPDCYMTGKQSQVVYFDGTVVYTTADECPRKLSDTSGRWFGPLVPPEG